MTKGVPGRYRPVLGLCRGAQKVCRFPYVTIESVLILDSSTLLVINDNNYPGTGGRDLNSDNTEFLKIRLDQDLNVGDEECGHDDGHEHSGSEE